MQSFRSRNSISRPWRGARETESVFEGVNGQDRMFYIAELNAPCANATKGKVVRICGSTNNSIVSGKLSRPL